MQLYSWFQNAKGSVEVAAKCFYRRKDLPANLLLAADRHTSKATKLRVTLSLFSICKVKDINVCPLDKSWELESFFPLCNITQFVYIHYDIVYNTLKLLTMLGVPANNITGVYLSQHMWFEVIFFFHFYLLPLY